jgi:hypothetical protein
MFFKVSKNRHWERFKSLEWFDIIITVKCSENITLLLKIFFFLQTRQILILTPLKYFGNVRFLLKKYFIIKWQALDCSKNVVSRSSGENLIITTIKLFWSRQIAFNIFFTCPNVLLLSPSKYFVSVRKLSKIQFLLQMAINQVHHCKNVLEADILEEESHIFDCFWKFYFTLNRPILTITYLKIFWKYEYIICMWLFSKILFHLQIAKALPLSPSKYILSAR